MSTPVKLSDSLIAEAKRYAEVYSRSVPKQIEHWSKIGKIVEENPDLPYDFIRSALLALEEVEGGKVSHFALRKANLRKMWEEGLASGEDVLDMRAIKQEARKCLESRKQ